MALDRHTTDATSSRIRIGLWVVAFLLGLATLIGTVNAFGSARLWPVALCQWLGMGCLAWAIRATRRPWSPAMLRTVMAGVAGTLVLWFVVPALLLSALG